MQESPIFSRTYDLLRWLLPMTVKFPRQHRFVLASALQQAAMEFQEQLIEARFATRATKTLHKADQTLTKLRLYLRLSHDLKLFSPGQYEHVSKMVDEIGRLLGGWIKGINASRTS
jgi:hypothetical protein